MQVDRINITGNNNISGNFIVGDKMIGNRISGDYVMGDKITGNKIKTHLENTDDFTLTVVEIQELLDNLSEIYNLNTNIGQEKISAEIAEFILHSPTFKARIINALKEGGYKALEDAIDRPAKNILIATLKILGEGLRNFIEDK